MEETFLNSYPKAFRLKSKSVYITLLGVLLSAVQCVSAKTYQLNGEVKGMEGEYISVLSYVDYFTETLTQDALLLLDSEGKFSLEYETELYEQIVFRTRKYQAQFIAGEQSSYDFSIDISTVQTPLKFTNDNWCQVKLKNLEPSDVNNRIEELNAFYNTYYDKYYPEIYQILTNPNSNVKESMSGEGKRIDLVKSADSELDEHQKVLSPEALLELFDAGLDEKNISLSGSDYLSVSARYMKAELESLLGKNELELRTEYCYADFHPRNTEYISFMKARFRNVLEEVYQSEKRNQFVKYLYNQDLDSAVISIAPIFEGCKANSLKLALLSGVENGLNLPNISNRDVTLLLELLRRDQGAPTQTMAREYFYALTKGKKDAKPRDFTLLDLDAEKHSFSDWEGQIVYLSAFATWNVESTGHLKRMKDLERKYGNQISFISICMDDNWDDFKEFLIENRNYNWLFLFGNSDQLLKEKLNLVTVPQYFLFDPEGLQIMDYAPSPEEGIERTFNSLLKTR